MAVLDGRQRFTRAAGAATVAAPVVRRLVADEALRSDLRAAVSAGRRLYEGFTDDGLSRLISDDDVRKDIDTLLAAAQDAGQRIMRTRRRMRWARTMIVGGAAALSVGVALAYPRSRGAIVHTFSRRRDEDLEAAA